VAIDIQLEKFIQENIIDIYTGTDFFSCKLDAVVFIEMLSALAILRQFRCKLIQTSDQYVFVHQTLVDSIANQVRNI
jgi:hypothetical protein